MYISNYHSSSKQKAWKHCEAKNYSAIKTGQMYYSFLQWIYFGYLKNIYLECIKIPEHVQGYFYCVKVKLLLSLLTQC